MGKKDVKNAKNKNEIVNEGNLVKFWISSISNFLKKKVIVLQNSLIKSRIYTRKEHKNFENFFDNYRQAK